MSIKFKPKLDELNTVKLVFFVGIVLYLLSLLFIVSLFEQQGRLLERIYSEQKLIQNKLDRINPPKAYYDH